jgi:dipeptidase E
VKLVFYGGGDGEVNRQIDALTIKLSSKKYPRIAYIPSCSFDSHVDFKDFVSQFTYFDITQFIYFPVDIPFDRVLMREVFKSDIIHLSGGNTFYFLASLRKSGLLPELKSFVQRGGVLTGLSAGAIMMTPSIQTAGFPEFDCDDNDEGLRNLKSLSLVPFEVFPHYKNSKRYETELIAYSKKSRLPLYAIPDGAGIIVDGNTQKFIGKVQCFFQERKSLVGR